MKKLLSNEFKSTQDNPATLQVFLHRLLILFFILSFAVTIYTGYLAYSYNIRVTPEFNFIYQIPEQGIVHKQFAYISGAVNKPGVYEINNTTRIEELIYLADGFSPTVDADSLSKEINLAEIVTDQQHIFIPDIREKTKTLSTESTPTSTYDQLVNINTASEKELDTLPGIGPSTARKIIEGRPYVAPEELKEVPGIGEKTFTDIESYITTQ